jgi:hypothetical protein
MIARSVVAAVSDRRRRSEIDATIYVALYSVVSHLRLDNRRDPLTRLASADENASSSLSPKGAREQVQLSPRPLGGEGGRPAALPPYRSQGARMSFSISRAVLTWSGKLVI